MAATPVPVTFVSSSAEIGGAELLLVSLLDSLDPGWVDSVVIPGARRARRARARPRATGSRSSRSGAAWGSSSQPCACAGS